MRALVALVCAAVAAASLARPAAAADIRIVGAQDGVPVVAVSGPLAAEDANAFELLAASLDKAVVTFDSDGGPLLTGVSLGLTIRDHGFTTEVLDKATCVSACALAWMAGSPRMIAASGKVGVRSTHEGALESDLPMVSAYLTQLKMSYAAIMPFLGWNRPDPLWLTSIELKGLGAETKSLERNPAIIRAGLAEPAAFPRADMIAAYAEIYARAPPPGGQDLEPELRDFAAGKIATDCHIPCAFGWGYHSDEAARLFQARQWKALAKLTVAHMEAEDLSYFYLAVAARHLGYPKAAETYLNTAYAYTTKSLYHCDRISNECHGHAFPQEELQELAILHGEAGAAPDARRVVIGAYVDCLAAQVRKLDDGASDAASIALAVEPACRERSRGLRQAMEPGWPDAARQAFDAAFERENMKVVTRLVLAIRKGGAP